MTQSIDSQIIKNIIDYLINIRVIKNEAEFCKRLNYASGNLAKIKNGSRQISANLIFKMEKEFGLNREYLSDDTKPIVTNLSVSEYDKHPLNTIEVQKTESSIVDMFLQTMEVMKEIIDKGDKRTNMLQESLKEQAELMKKSFDALDKNNTHLRQEAELYRRMVADAYDSGLLQWEKKDKRSENIRELYKDQDVYQKSMNFLGRPESELTVCVVDAQGNVTYVNDEFTRQTGYSLEEIKGKRVGPILQRENSNQKSLQKIRDAIKNKKYYEGEVINYSKAGDEVSCRLTITPVLDRNGDLERFISLAIFSKVNEMAQNLKSS